MPKRQVTFPVLDADSYIGYDEENNIGAIFFNLNRPCTEASAAGNPMLAKTGWIHGAFPGYSVSAMAMPEPKRRSGGNSKTPSL